jgi:hypothetical protein
MNAREKRQLIGKRLLRKQLRKRLRWNKGVKPAKKPQEVAA